MSKLYGPDEGYEVVRSRSSKKVKTTDSQHVSLYKTVRGKISELICDQELVLQGPPFHPVVDLDNLSHDQFVKRASRVITKLNPEGHPPPGVSAPSMMSLIERLEISRDEGRPSYASVLQNGSPTSSQSSVPSYRGSVLTEDLSSPDDAAHVEHEETAVTATAKSAAKSPARASPRTRKSRPQKVVKKTMKVSFAPLDMTSSQYAISTVQERSAPPRREGSREVISTERLGDFYTGRKKLTSSAVRLRTAEEDDKDVDELMEYYQRKEQSALHRATMVRGRSSMVEATEDEAIVTDELVIGDDHAPKKRRTADDHDQAFNDVLHQDDEIREEFKSQSTQDMLLDAPSRPTSTRAIIERQSRINRAAIRKVVSNAVIAPTPVPETDTGHNCALFYELVARNEMLQHTVIDYEEPSYHEDSVLWNEDIGQDAFVLPKKDWDSHTLSNDEQHVYNDAQTRYEYLHKHRACFHDVYSIDDIIPTITELPSDLHLYLVVTGSALTNYSWSVTSTFQTDKEKYVAALRRCRRQFGTFTVHFGEIPFSHIRVEHLLLLPIPTIIEYLLYHGVSYQRLPWTYVGTANEATLQRLRDLPVDTTVPFKEWIKYLVDLGTYLNTVLTMKEDSFSIMREHFSVREDPSLSNADASRFVDTHFQLEGSRLRGDMSKYQLLERATQFAYQEKYIGDMKEHCSPQWLVFLYFILWGRFPPSTPSGYDTHHCIKKILAMNADVDLEEPPNLRHLLLGPPHLMWAFLKEDRSANKLYGASIDRATIGIQRLMVAGVLMYWYMDHTGSSNIDHAIPSGILSYVLWAKGVLNPTQEAQPRFSSQFIPVYKLTTVALAVRAVINAGVPVAAIPPKSDIPQDMSNGDYQHYYNDRICTITTSTIKQEGELFFRPNKWVPGLATGPCLFPYPPRGQVSDFSEVSVTGYLFHEGQRMIKLVNAALVPPGTSPALPTTSSSSSRVQHPWTTKPPLKQTTMDAYVPSASGSTSSYRSPPCTTRGSDRASSYQPTIVTLAQLQANRAAVQQSNNLQEYVATPDLTVSWSDYSATVTEYLDKLGFHTTGERKLKVDDNLVLICDAKQNNWGNNDIMQFAHMQYRVDHISLAGTFVHLHYITLLNKGSAQITVARNPPAKLTIHVLNEYILLKEQLASDRLSSSLPSYRPERSSDRSDGNAEDPQPSGDARRRSELRSRRQGDQHDDTDNLSEDSEARRTTKKSTMEVNGETFEIYGKTIIRENLVKSTGMRRTMQQGQLDKLLRTAGLGNYGNNITATNIIDGVIKLADDNNAASIFSKLNTSINHNKQQVTLQAWRQHPDLYEKIAYGIYEYGHNLTKTSVRCEHFLPHAVALEINYNISTYSHFLEHFKGWRQLLQELLGPDYGRLLQEFLTEMYDQQFGERNGVPYLKALTEAWRCEFYRYSIRQDSFQVMGQAELYDPKSMTLNDWLSILRFQYADFKSSLTVMKEMEFTQNKLISKVVEAKPLGHKPKVVLPAEQKAVRVEANVGKDKKAPAKATPAPAPAKKAKAGEKRKAPALDVSINVCIGDLLNHYGASQQVPCPTPCRYVHYTDLVQGTSKQLVLHKFQIVAPKLKLTEATIALMTKKINLDSKFK